MNLPPKPPSVHSFSKLPTFQEWINLSDAGLSFPKPPRRNDSALVKIDNLVLALNHATDVATRAYLLSVLWFTTGYWHNHLQDDPGRQKIRKSAIMSLLLFAQNTLGAALGCGVGGLAARLTQIYGKTMDTHGHMCDFGEKGKDFYLTEAERDKFRIVFFNKLAHRFEYRQLDWKAKPLVLLDTKTGGYVRGNLIEDAEEAGWAYFVMSMSSEIYIGPHVEKAIKGPDGNILYPKFHSSYMGGKNVQCGGTMRVVNGVVTGLKNDSGHYKPVDESMVKVLELLRTVGMDISKAEVHPVGAGGMVKGDVFLKQNGNWDAIRKGNCAQMYADFSSGKKDLLQLVNQYFEKERATKLLNSLPVIEKDIWAAAYRAVCWDLALFDAKWKARADAPPIPRTAHPSIGVKKVA
jgi:hypothetical protein